MAGIQDIPHIIPEKWNATWFRRFIAEYLAKLDTRNSIGVGIAVDSDGNSVATLDLGTSVSDAIDAHVALSDPHAQYATDQDLVDHEAAADPHPGYLTQTEGDALYAPLVHSHAVTWYTPASVTKVEGGAVTGTVAGVQTMLDGSLYEVVEAAGTPGFDLEFAFSGITKTPTEIVVRVLYEGISTHGVAVELWDYTGTPAYDRVHQFTAMLDYQVIYIPLPSWSNYLSGGAAKLRIVHFSAGNPAHDVHIDYVAIRAAT